MRGARENREAWEIPLFRFVMGYRCMEEPRRGQPMHHRCRASLRAQQDKKASCDTWATDKAERQRSETREKERSGKNIPREKIAPARRGRNPGTPCDPGIQAFRGTHGSQVSPELARGLCGMREWGSGDSREKSPGGEKWGGRCRDDILFIKRRMSGRWFYKEVLP